MEIRIENMTPMRVAFIRHNGPYETCCQAWGQLYDWAARNHFVGPGTIGVGASYDDPELTPPEEIRYDACLTCNENFNSNGEVSVQMLGGGKYATCIHRGPYRGLKRSFRQILREWIPQSGRLPRQAPCLEIYIDDPDKTPEEDLRTKICVPIE
jgi:AraC family transcriptional regulator